MANRNLRNLIPLLVPSWLSSGDYGAVLYAAASLVDISVQRLRSGLEARFPRYAGPSALALIGVNRGIIRGRDETDTHYAERLVRWRWPRGHRTRGSAFAWIEQVAEYFGGLATSAIDVNGNRFRRSASANGLTPVESVERGVAWTWDAGASIGRARFWGAVDARGVFRAHPALTDPTAYGGTWDPASSYTIGQLGATPADAAAMRRLMTGRAWRPAGTWAEWIIFYVDVDTDEASIVPGPTWARWSTVDGGGLRVETRAAGARYWSLAPARNNVYGGDAAQWTGLTLPGSGAYAEGDPASFPASVTLPGGSTYGGDPARFPTTAQLVDDGDHL